jgi:hypothetical protein
MWKTPHPAGRRDVTKNDIGRRRSEDQPRGDFRQARKKGASMEQVSNHNAFNILFAVSFFASFALVMIHFG